MIVAGVGVSHCFGAISTLHQVHATIMMAVGGGSSFILLIIALVMKVRNRRHLTKPIKNFTKKCFIKEKRESHETAKHYLQEELQKIRAEVAFVLGNVPPYQPLSSKEVTTQIMNDDPLDKKIFFSKFANTLGEEIQKDGKDPCQIVLYGVASQFNGAQSSGHSTVPLGQAVKTYQGDNTQGAKVQLEFPNKQVEIINNGANLGFNGLCRVLDDETIDAVSHGYLNPKTFEQARLVIKQLKDQDHPIEYLCVGNIPKGKENTETVYEILVAAPAFGAYSDCSTITEQQKKEIAYLCAVRGYSAQFEQALKLAKENPNKTVIFKPTAPGLGIFDNDEEMVAKGFYTAAKEYEQKLREADVLVRWEMNSSHSLKTASALMLVLKYLNLKDCK
ncbi:MAG: hypothetical protein R3E91_02380 [Chlamydiales bacterium]